MRSKKHGNKQIQAAEFFSGHQTEISTAAMYKTSRFLLNRRHTTSGKRRPEFDVFTYSKWYLTQHQGSQRCERIRPIDYIQNTLFFPCISKNCTARTVKHEDMPLHVSLKNLYNL